MSQRPDIVDEDELSNFIREIDGNNKMGAGALAEKLSERFVIMKPTDMKSVGWQFFCPTSKEWHIGSDKNDHRKNTVEGGYQVRDLFAGPVIENDPLVEGILDLIMKQCKYWQGKDEARRGGFATLLHQASELVEQSKLTET